MAASKIARNIFVLLACPAVAFSQSADSTETSTFDQRKFNRVIIPSAAIYTASLIGLNQLWYRDDERTAFHFFNDNAEWQQVDKVGHFYSSFYVSYGTASILRWTGIKEQRADLYGSMAGFALLIPIEIFDGFSDDYGASAGDLIANAAGSLMYVGQKSLWNEIRIQPRFSFHFSEFAGRRPEVLGSSRLQQILKDYNGQTYWLSADLDKFFRFPRYINLAVGYGADNMIFARDADHSHIRQYYLSLDIDLSGIETRSKTLKTVFKMLSMVKLPSPAIAFTRRSAKLHAAYF